MTEKTEKPVLADTPNTGLKIRAGQPLAGYVMTAETIYRTEGSVVIKAAGAAISSAVSVALVAARHLGCKTTASISTREMEGKDKQQHNVSFIEIFLK